jgi:hypothetical protein
MLFRGDMLPLFRRTIRLEIGTIGVGAREWVIEVMFRRLRLRRPLLAAGSVLVALGSVAIVARLRGINVIGISPSLDAVSVLSKLAHGAGLCFGITYQGSGWPLSIIHPHSITVRLILLLLVIRVSN